jgi:SAM-dependent methyltransferase
LPKSRAYTAVAMSARRRRKKVKSALIRSRIPLKGQLARGYLRGRERYMSVRAGRDLVTEIAGLPVPPAPLRVLVAGDPDLDSFLGSGRAQAGYLRDLLAEAGHPLSGMDAILDFGCGCGRIARWFSDLVGPRVDGCDYNGELVEWCNANLGGFFRARRTGLEPPLPYAGESYDFLYAFSVFTHLSVPLAGEWMAEMHRVVRPGGFIWFTLHGESYRERLLPEEKMRFDAGEIVVWLPEIQGTNMCGAYWPDAAVERMLSDRFEIVVHFDPQAEPAAATSMNIAHDAYLVRRR